jgi:ribosomal protein S18 acetylase RimI-like enzyme
MTNEPRLAEDPWLSARLGKPAFHLLGDLAQLASCETRLQRELSAGHVFADVKVPVNDLLAVSTVQKLGFLLVDTNLGFSIACRDLPQVDCTDVLFAQPGMEQAVGTIAEKSLICDRFHHDTDIPSSTASDIKRVWAQNYFRGLRGDWMVVARRHGIPVGFLQLLRSPRAELIIDLIAVDSAHRRQGIARAMIAFAAKHCDAMESMAVGTQAANISSARLYENLGFRLRSAHYVFHHHGRLCASVR